MVVTVECLYLFRYGGCYCAKVQVQIVANQEIISPAGKVVHTVNCEIVTPARVEVSILSLHFAANPTSTPAGVEVGLQIARNEKIATPAG